MDRVSLEVVHLSGPADGSDAAAAPPPRWPPDRLMDGQMTCPGQPNDLSAGRPQRQTDGTGDGQTGDGRPPQR